MMTSMTLSFYKKMSLPGGKSRYDGNQAEEETVALRA
jgi:hypothetical protein